MSFYEESRREIERLYSLIDLVKGIRTKLEPILNESLEDFDELIRLLSDKRLIEEAKSSEQGLLELRMLNDMVEGMIGALTGTLLDSFMKEMVIDFVNRAILEENLKGNELPDDPEEFILGVLKSIGINPDDVKVVKLPKELDDASEDEIIEQIISNSNGKITRQTLKQPKMPTFTRDYFGINDKKNKDSKVLEDRFADILDKPITFDSNDAEKSEENADDNDEERE